MTDGYRALRETAAQIDLSARGRIKVTGDDRARLLHAMTTNHINGLAPGAGCYAFFLNAQGRILADANVLCFEDHFLLDTEPESRAFLLEHLDKYIIADDVVLEDVTGSTVAVGIEGPGAEALLKGAGWPTPRNPLESAAHGQVTVVRASYTGAPGLRLIAPSAAAVFPYATPAGARDAAVVRLEHFQPRYNEDITSANLAQETHITDALHFSKGCYLGQEIVERVRSRGHVNRMLIGLRIEGEAAVAKGAKISFEGAEVGEVTSALWSPALATTVGLGYVRVAAGKPGTPLVIDGRPAYAEAIKSCRT
jgi:aminomethyltransferase